MGDFDDWDEYNFIWTQWKSNRVLASIKTWKEVNEQEAKDALNPDKKRSSQSTRAGGHTVDSQLSTQATDKDSTSSKENLIHTPKKNKLASSTLGNTSSEPQFKKQSTTTSATKTTQLAIRGKKGRPMHLRLAEELISAFNREGTAMTTRDNVHRMADANKAFAHFAW